MIDVLFHVHHTPATGYEAKLRRRRHFHMGNAQFCVSFQGFSDGGGWPLHRLCASLHSHGGAFHSVTYGERKYHCSLYMVFAHKPATACFHVSVARSALLSIPAHPLARIYKTNLLALFSCRTGLSARKSVFIINALFQNDNNHTLEAVPQTGQAIRYAE